MYDSPDSFTENQEEPLKKLFILNMLKNTQHESYIRNIEADHERPTSRTESNIICIYSLGNEKLPKVFK